MLASGLFCFPGFGGAKNRGVSASGCVLPMTVSNTGCVLQCAKHAANGERGKHHLHGQGTLPHNPKTTRADTRTQRDDTTRDLYFPTLIAPTLRAPWGSRWFGRRACIRLPNARHHKWVFQPWGKHRMRNAERCRGDPGRCNGPAAGPAL